MQCHGKPLPETTNKNDNSFNLSESPLTYEYGFGNYGSCGNGYQTRKQQREGSYKERDGHQQEKRLWSVDVESGPFVIVAHQTDHYYAKNLKKNVGKFVIRMRS